VLCAIARVVARTAIVTVVVAPGGSEPGGGVRPPVTNVVGRSIRWEEACYSHSPTMASPAWALTHR
jgi:hypothetical protein